MSDESRKMLKAKQALFLATRNCIAPALQNDTDEIKSLRDYHCFDMLGKDYTELNYDEICVVIDVLNLLAKGGNITKCTVSQRRLLTYYQFHYAFKYADWDNAIFKVESGKNLTGINLKMYAQSKFEKKEKLDTAIYKFIYENYINPKSHEFLIEGEFKSMVRNKRVLHYEYLTPQEANYLIQRFGQMFIVLNNTGKLLNVEMTGSLN